MKSLRRSLAVLLAVLAGPALGQITIFEHDNFAGRAMDLYEATPDLANTGMNDVTSSVIVRSGAWQLCEHAGFAGRCITLARGEYPSMNAMGMNDMISSARPVGGPPPGAGVPPAPPARGRIVLFDGSDFSGGSVAFDQVVPNLDRVGFNDRAVSAIVYDGTWEVCEHADFHGDCIRLGPGRHPDLGPVSGRASSLRPIAGGPPVAVAPPPVGPPPGAVRVVLYSRPDFGGRSVVIDHNRVRTLDDYGFNDRARSLRVERGYWMFCSEPDFEGDCRTFGPGDYPNLPSGLAGRISSGRRISEEYPYSGPPNWGPR